MWGGVRQGFVDFAGGSMENRWALGGIIIFIRLFANKYKQHKLWSSG